MMIRVIQREAKSSFYPLLVATLTPGALFSPDFVPKTTETLRNEFEEASSIDVGKLKWKELVKKKHPCVELQIYRLDGAIRMYLSEFSGEKERTCDEIRECLYDSSIKLSDGVEVNWSSLYAMALADDCEIDRVDVYDRIASTVKAAASNAYLTTRNLLAHVFVNHFDPREIRRFCQDHCETAQL